MRCAACGQLVLEGTKYCPSCGAKIEGQAPADEQNYTASDAASGAGWSADQGYTENTYRDHSYTDGSSYTFYEHQKSYQPPMPMKWYKFLIYVSLLLNGVINVFTGIQALMGIQYIAEDENLAGQVYGLYPGLKEVDMVYAVVSIAFGICAFVVRQKLAHYRKDGPKSLLMLYGASLIISVIYMIAVMVVTGINVMNMSIIMNLVLAVVMIVVNKIYFDKRKHLFTE